MNNTDLINSRYRLLNKIGEGGMGTVYRAADRLTGQTVALKRVTVAGDQLDFASQSTDQDFRLSLAQEFRTLAGLRHPHIVSVLDYGFDRQRQPFFTMQLIEGAQELTDYAVKLSQACKVRVLVETLQALAYLHRRGIIHRDLKPGNVLVTTDGSVRVMDFGLALTQAERTTDDATSPVGTLTYMAPELFKDQPASVQSDLYALGVMAYEIFLGHYPFTSQNVILMVNEILNTPPDTTDLDFELGMVIDKLLAKEPQDRYQSADAIIEALIIATDQGMPEENTALRESYLQAAKFVGRDAESGQLLATLDQSIKGQGSGWLIGGESGVGKSRLIDELRTHALVAGATVLRGQGVEGAGLPYQLWREPLRYLVLSTTLSDLEAGILKPLVPDISTLLERAVPDAPEIPGQAGRQRLMLTIAAIFKRQSTPIVLLLEDLQWAAGSLFPLQHLNELVSTLPLFIIGTYRDDETPDLPAELPTMRLLKLSRLTEEAIAELSESMLGEAGTQPDLLNLLTRETEGNTFFMVEVVRALAEEAGRLENIGVMPLPKSILTGGVDRIVRRRLNRVPEKFSPWLTLAAIAGRQLDLKVLTYAVAPDNLEEFLTTCAGAAVLEISEGTWRFAHDKLRESLIKNIDPIQRPALHRQIAEAIEAIYPDTEASAYSEVLLEHWYNAGDIEKTLYYTEPACNRLILVMANYAAARSIITRSMTLIDQLPTEKQDQYRAILLRLQAVIDQRLGDYPEAIANYEASLQYTGADSQIRVRVLTGLSTVTEYQGDNRASGAYAKQALELAEQIGDRQGIGESLNNLGIVALNLADYDTARRYYEQSLAIKKELGNQRGVSAALNNLAVLFYQLGDYPASIDYQEQSLAIDREMGDRLGIADGLSNLGTVQSKLGNHEAARAYYEQSLVIDYEIGDRRGIAGTMMNIGNVAFDLKDYASARSYYEESLELSRAIGDQRGTPLALLRMGLVTLEFNEIPVARNFLQEGLQSSLENELTQFMVEGVLHFAYLHFLNRDLTTSAVWLGMVAVQPVDGDTPVELIQALQAKLETVMGKEALSVAMERGKDLDLEVVVKQILTEVGAPST